MVETLTENKLKSFIGSLNKERWQTYKFSEIAFNIVEKVTPKESELTHYIGLEHLDSGSVHIKRFGDPQSLDGDKLKIYKEDVIVGKRNAYLKRAAVAEFGAIASAHSFVLRANSVVILPELFPFFMLSETFWETAIRISVGSLSPTINWKTLAVQKFLLPPKEQQAKLAELLWGADGVIESYLNLKQANEVLHKVYRERSIYEHASASIKLSSYLTSITAGKSLNGKSEPVENESEFGVLKVSAVGPNGFDANENKSLINQSEFRNNFAVKSNDLLITRANTTELVGRVCLVDEDYNNLMLSDKTLRLELDENKCNKVYIHEVLKSKKVREQIEGSATGTGGAMKNISQNEIRNLLIPRQTIDVQNQIADNVVNLKSQNKKIDALIELSREMQRSLINQIFS